MKGKRKYSLNKTRCTCGECPRFTLGYDSRLNDYYLNPIPTIRGIMVQSPIGEIATKQIFVFIDGGGN